MDGQGQQQQQQGGQADEATISSVRLPSADRDARPQVEQSAAASGSGSGSGFHQSQSGASSSFHQMSASTSQEGATRIGEDAARPFSQDPLLRQTSGSMPQGNEQRRQNDPSHDARERPQHQQPGHPAEAASMHGLGRPTTGFAALVDRFVSNFRNTMERHNAGNGTQQEGDEQQQPAQPPRVSEALAAAATDTFGNSASDTTREAPSQSQPSTEDQAPPSTESTTNEHPPRPHMLIFRMPIVDAQGNPATIGFMPGPIPVPEAGAAEPTYGPERPPHLGADRGNGRASGYHLPESPIFVPIGTSPLPFSFLFDSQTNTAWPILNMSQGPPGSMPPETTGANTPRFITGPPFRIALNFHFAPPPEPEQPDEERAKRFVASLERADAELRARLARLGMGDIGGETGQDAIGCGICLEEYPTEDRPEWIGGQSSIDEEVVAVPCGGHHTLHHSCLYGWLAKTPPSQWSCPFCRAKLDKAKVDDSALPDQRSTQPAANMRRSESAGDATKTSSEGLKPRSLRDEVRFRERMHGWRCDSPACLPRYPDLPDIVTDVSEPAVCNERGDLVTLLPCHHRIHVDCLCTSMKLEQAEAGSPNPDAVLEVEEDDEEEADGDAEKAAADDGVAKPTHRRLSSSRQTVGKWVTCPTCRHEAWAELPVRRRPKRAEAQPTAKAVEEKTEPAASTKTVEEHLDAHALKSTDFGQAGGPRQQARLRDMEAQNEQHGADSLQVPDAAHASSHPQQRLSEDSNAARSDVDVEALLS